MRFLKFITIWLVLSAITWILLSSDPASQPPLPLFKTSQQSELIIALLLALAYTKFLFWLGRLRWSQFLISSSLIISCVALYYIPQLEPFNHLNRLYQVAAGIFAPALIPFTVFLLAQMFEESPSPGSGSALHN